MHSRKTPGVALFGTLRVALGAVALLRPAMLPKIIGVDSATSERITWLVWMVGAREVALGMGTLLDLRGGGDGRDWLLAQAVSDAADACAISMAVARGHANRLSGGAVAVLAAAGAAGEAAALRRIHADA